MPIYGEAKQRNMIRSILPSTGRKRARTSLAMAKRHNRRYIRQALHNVALDVELWEETTGYDEYPYEDRGWGEYSIRQIVSDRRGADKVAPMMRWAPSQVEGVRREDRMSKLLAILPKNTIGRHAASHVDKTEAFATPDDIAKGYYWWQHHNSPEKRAELAFVNACRFAALAERLEKVLHDRRHRELNRILKKPVVRSERQRVAMYKYDWVRLPDEPGRPLYGRHDIEGCLLHYAKRPDLVTKLLTALDKVEKPR